MAKKKYTLYRRVSRLRDWSHCDVFDTARELAEYIVHNGFSIEDIENCRVMYGCECKVEVIENGRSIFIESGQDGHAYSWTKKSLAKKCPTCGLSGNGRLVEPGEMRPIKDENDCLYPKCKANRCLYWGLWGCTSK